jgi:hypothetical protein
METLQRTNIDHVKANKLTLPYLGLGAVHNLAESILHLVNKEINLNLFKVENNTVQKAGLSYCLA